MFSASLPPGMLAPRVLPENFKGRPRHKQPLYRKAMWTPHEDDLLRKAVETCGTKNWSLISSMVPGRNGKQCRERWSGMLDPDLAKEDWSIEEDRLLIQLHGEFGNKWAKISEFLPGRSRISLRNRWGWHVRHQFQLTGPAPSSPKVDFEGTPISDIIDSKTVVKFEGKSWEELDSWTGEIEGDLWMEVNQPWFA